MPKAIRMSQYVEHPAGMRRARRQSAEGAVQIETADEEGGGEPSRPARARLRRPPEQSAEDQANVLKCKSIGTSLSRTSRALSVRTKG